MTEELRHGSLDTEFSISDERARELLAQIAAGDAEKPFTELSEAYGHHVRRILAARVKDKTELEDVLQDFWIHVAQNAGKYGGKAPVKRWLLVIASRLGIASYRRLSRRQKRVLYRAEMASKMPDAGEEDDLDLERLADESIESLRSIQPDESMEQEEKEAASRRLVQYLEQSEDRATRLLYRRYIEGASPASKWQRKSISNQRLCALGSATPWLPCGKLSSMCIRGGRFGICE